MNRIFGLLLICFVGLAQAEPVTWYLVDIKFADGGTASGSFGYDADTNAYSNVAVTSTSSGAFRGADYGYGMLIAEFAPSATNVNFSPSSQPAAGEGELVIEFAFPLTNGAVQLQLPHKAVFQKRGSALRHHRTRSGSSPAMAVD